MAHIIDETCCKQRNCNKCDGYRKEVESLQAKLEQLHRVSIEDKAKLGEYRILEGQGLLLKLPCKVGDTAYRIANECHGDSFRCYQSCSKCSDNHRLVEEIAFTLYWAYEVGKTVFSTKEEAEKRLAELEGEVE